MKEYVIYKKQIYIYGVGFKGVQLFYRLKEAGYDISGFLDQYETGRLFEKNIIHPDNLPPESFVLISSEQYYGEMKAKLVSKGLKEFDDFIKGDAFEKKIVVLIANCYAEHISAYLNSNKEFTSRYFIYQIIKLNNPEKKYTLDDTIMKKSDVCIYQNFLNAKVFGADFFQENIEKKLSRTCKKVVIPNLVGMGKIFYIQAEKNERASIGWYKKCKMFECKDIVIDKLISDGMSVEEIQNYIKHRLVFSKEEVVENFNYIIEKFKLREKNCDVKITDFILENYKNYQMFYDLYHASAKVISEMTRRILIELGIENTKLSEQEFEYSGGEMPIYKDIAKALNLKYWSEDGEIRKKSYRKYTDVMNLDEYIKEYIFLKDVD